MATHGFVEKVREQVTPGTSALFLLSSDAVMDRVRDAFAEHGPDELVFTDLGRERETALHEAFG